MGNTGKGSRRVRSLLSVMIVSVMMFSTVGVIPAIATWKTADDAILISSGPAGTPADDDSWNATISDNGRYICFETDASNLTGGGSTDRNKVMRYDRLSGAMREVSAAPGIISGRGAREASMSDDGRHVLFLTGETLSDEDENGEQDFYVRDMLTGEFRWIDYMGDGSSIPYARDVYDARLSGDGTYFVFEYAEDDLLGSGKTTEQRNIWGYDLESDEATLVSVPATDTAIADRGARDGVISDDGRYVAFVTGDGWDEDDDNESQDIYVRDMETGEFRWIDFVGDGTPLGYEVRDVAISGDGSRIAFTYYYDLLGDGTNARNVYSYDLESDEATLVSGPELESRGSRNPSISDDGRYVMFYTGQPFSEEDENGDQDIYIKDMVTGEFSRVALKQDGGLPGDDIDELVMSGDAHHLVFQSDVDFVGDTNDQDDIYYAGIPIPMLEGAQRVAGANRYATAVDVSKRAFPNGASTVVLATGENWPDALAGAGLAGAIDGPVLLTRSDVLSPETKAEIKRLGARNVYVLGGPSSVSVSIERQLDWMLTGFVQRIAGVDRYDTSRKVSKKAIGLLGAQFDGRVCVTTGQNFPDAVSAAPLSAGIGWPVVLVRPTDSVVELHPAVTHALLIGDGKAVSASAEAYLNSKLGDVRVDRCGGSSRYETSALVAQYGVDHGLLWDGVGISTGTNFPDALAGGASLGLDRSVLLLTPREVLHSAAASKLRANKADIDSFGVLGGPDTVSATVMSQVKALLGL